MPKVNDDIIAWLEARRDEYVRRGSTEDTIAAQELSSAITGIKNGQPAKWAKKRAKQK